MSLMKGYLFCSHSTSFLWAAAHREQASSSLLRIFSASVGPDSTDLLELLKNRVSENGAAQLRQYPTPDINTVM